MEIGLHRLFGQASEGPDRCELREDHLMGAKHIDHIAFRVKDLEKAVKFYTEVMDFKVTDRFFIDFDDNTKARCAALQASDGNGISIFLSEGEGDGGVVKEWVKQHGNALHHIAYAVDD